MKILEKCPTGIQGLDEITGGGLPRGRPTLVCGTFGCGKTVLAMEFLVRGAVQFDESGVFFAFEESPDDLTKNFASMGFDLDDLCACQKLGLNHICIDRSQLQEMGDYDLEGLFIRLNYAIDMIGAKRVVLDTLEALFGRFTRQDILRAELRRLFQWLKDKGVTALITAERGTESLTRHGLEEYVADCVIMLDHRVQDQMATRRLRIVKYRGSQHGINEFPFLISQNGIFIQPITSLGLNHPASTQLISLGLDTLDALLGGGCYRGSSIVVSGTSGTGKSTLAAYFADAACSRGERALYFAFEESPQQITRNMRAIGLDLEPWLQGGLLEIQAARPTLSGLEWHLSRLYRSVAEFNPQVIVMDPISNLVAVGDVPQVKAMLVRFIDFLKLKQITGMFLNLIVGGDDLWYTKLRIASLMDTWIVLKDMANSGERVRALEIIKSRGMPHSNQPREFFLTSRGLKIVEVPPEAMGTLGGSGLDHEAQAKTEVLLRQQKLTETQRGLERKRAALEAKIDAMRAEFEAEAVGLQTVLVHEQRCLAALTQDREDFYQEG